MLKTTPEAEYIQKPQEVQGIQYFAATDPPPLGVCTCQFNPAFPDPHAHIAMVGWLALHDTDWLVHDVISEQLIAVLSDAEFQARYRHPAAVPEPTTD